MFVDSINVFDCRQSGVIIISSLTLCMLMNSACWVILHDFLMSAYFLLFFFFFLLNPIMKCQNSLDSLSRMSPYRGCPNSLQRTDKLRVKFIVKFEHVYFTTLRDVLKVF